MHQLSLYMFFIVLQHSHLCAVEGYAGCQCAKNWFYTDPDTNKDFGPYNDCESPDGNHPWCFVQPSTCATGPPCLDPDDPESEPWDVCRDFGDTTSASTPGSKTGCKGVFGPSPAPASRPAPPSPRSPSPESAVSSPPARAIKCGTSTDPCGTTTG